MMRMIPANELKIKPAITEENINSFIFNFNTLVTRANEVGRNHTTIIFGKPSSSYRECKEAFQKEVEEKIIPLIRENGYAVSFKSIDISEKYRFFNYIMEVFWETM